MTYVSRSIFHGTYDHACGWIGRLMCRTLRLHNASCRGRVDHLPLVRSGDYRETRWP